jgi:cytochrome c554/c'-like protein
MLTRLLASAIVLGLAYTTGAVVDHQDPGMPAPGYAWADACRKCHEPVYVAWARTKHAAALNRLSAAEQDLPCVGCHVTGSKTRLLDGGKVLNAGVQCEACHGAASAHVADPKVRTGLVRKPPSSTCEACHSSSGPHFKGFWYDAMAGLSHRVS